jgi:hypothetical protein
MKTQLFLTLNSRTPNITKARLFREVATDGRLKKQEREKQRKKGKKREKRGKKKIAATHKAHKAMSIS